ncbi:MAG: TatD family hydrolase [Polyangiaceae bacterium]
MWFDTHCHLDADNTEGDAEAVIERARQAGVGYFTCIGVGGLEPMRQAVALAERHDNVWATVGVHPHDAATLDAALEAELEAALAHPRVVALGEVGLDYHYDHSPRERQREVFARMIALGRAHEKTIVVHTRSAAAETLELLESESARDVGGIIHCFSEDRAFAGRALDMGFDLSFSGILTFKNAKAIQEVAAWAPNERVLIETDSPYLAPVPLRGKRCEPAYLVHTAAHLAKLRGVEVSDLCAQTTHNAARRFGVDLSSRKMTDTLPGCAAFASSQGR